MHRVLLHAMRIKIKKWFKQNKAPKWYTKDLRAFVQAHRQVFGKDPDLEEFPCLNDNTPTTGFDSHYTYQGPWVMRNLLHRRPAKHVDVGSWTAYLGFFSSLQPTEFVDIRPAQLSLPGLTPREGSVLHLPYTENSLESLSCLHVVEHIGLGRYGDPIDPLGTMKALRELSRVVAKGGDLYLSLPVGVEKIFFNAHRVTHPRVVLENMEGMKLVSLSGVLDDGQYLENAELELLSRQKYACGLFHFMK